jgi:hypothetical protein
MASPAAAATPDTQITAGPSGPVAKKSATFKFKATVSGASFQCKIDSKDWASCDSPKKYKRLKQGEHTFQVRARKGHAVDKTPATRSFTVDTVPPDTAVYGPQDNQATYANGYTEDQTPESVFSLSGPTEPVTFECRITSASSTPPFMPCDSPYSPADPLPRDAFYTIKARAIDEAGNVDPTPGSWDFSVETPITEDQQTLDQALAIQFPTAATMDVPASCGGSTPIDCPGGNALPADDDQLSTSSSNVSAVSAGPNSHQYNVTATNGTQTFSPVVVGVPLVGDCNLSINSADGSSDHWTVTESLQFVTGAYSPILGQIPGGKFISPQNTSISGAEAADFALGGNFGCQFASLQLALFTDTLTQTYSSTLYRPLCAKLGPGYIEPCP